MSTIQEDVEQIIRKVLDEKLGTNVKSEFANSVEISNANSKGELHVTIKGRSDGDLKELVKKCLEEYNGAKTQ